MRTDPLASAVFLIVALSVAGLAHSAWLRAPVSRRFAIPLDAGLCVRGRRVFGENKTVRGFLVMVPAAALSFMTLFVILARLAPGVADSLWSLAPAGYASL